MNVEVIKPINPSLRKYIECFYILTHSKKNGKTTYLTFPSIHSIVSVSSNTDITRLDEYIKLSESSSPNFTSELEVKFTNPLLIQYEGYIKEITIYFKPLGLNAFLDKQLNDYSDKEQFIPFSDYIDTMQAILKITSSDETIKQLENYWSSKLKPNSYLKLKQAINTILENPDTSISSIAKNYNVSHKTLIAHFNKNVCKTPSEFRKIVRFRKALSNKKDDNLTQLSYVSNYFDQAHMIKDFNKLTGHNPKSFFKKLSTIEKTINWIFLSNSNS